MSRRREARSEATFEVKVWGLDRFGKPFVQQARTVNVTRAGALLEGIDCVKVGEVLGLQVGEEQARYKVIWVGRENTPRAGQIGVSNLEPDKVLFKALPSQPDQSWSNGQSTPATSRLQPPAAAIPRLRDTTDARRKYPRYNCRGMAELKLQASSTPERANLSDVSLTGCYVESTSPLPAGTEVFFQLKVEGQIISGRAVVKTSHHGVGMGMAFLHLASDDQRALEFLVSSLASGLEVQPEIKPHPAPPPPPTPSIRTAAAIAAPPAAPSGGNAAGISAQIMRCIAELNELEQSLVKDRVDPRLLAQFHDAMEHIRQTAWTVQQWLEMKSGGGDPFSVLPQLEAERMHMFTKLAHNVTADIDSAGITEFSEGVTELYESAQQLYRRLRKLLVGAEDDTGANPKAKGTTP